MAGFLIQNQFDNGASQLILPCGSAILNVNTANVVSRLVRLHVLTKTWCFLSSLSHMSPVCSSPLFPHVSCLLFHHVSYSLRSLVYSCLPHVPFTAGLLFPRVSCHFMSPVLPCLTYISSFRVPYPLKSAVSSSLLSLQVLCLPMSPIP